MRTWLTWSELISAPRISSEEFRAQLSVFPKSAILIACCRLSVGFRYGYEGKTVPEPEVLDKLAPHLFPPKLWKFVSSYAGKDRIIFFQGQLRYLAAETVRLIRKGDVPEDPNLGPQNQQFGELMLKAGELLYKKHVVVHDEFDGLANIAAEFLPTYENDCPTDPIFNLLRFYIWLTRIIPRVPAHLRKFDPEVEFKKVFPFPILTYAEFLAAFALHAFKERVDQNYDAPIDATLRKSWFKNTNLPKETLEQMFETVSFCLDKLPEPKDTLGYADFEFLKDRPYFLFKEDMYMLDYEFALGKLESAAVWRVLRTLPKNKKEPWLSYWGHVFEEYVFWMFETYANPELHELYPSPTYVKSTDQISDLIVVHEQTAVLIEAKLATCASSIRYSGDYAQVRTYMEDKLVTGAGVCQLVNAVKTIGDKADKLPTYLKHVKKSFP